MKAFSSGRMDILQILVENGANVNVQNTVSYFELI